MDVNSHTYAQTPITVAVEYTLVALLINLVLFFIAFFQVNYEIEQCVDITGVFWVEAVGNELHMRVDANLYRVKDNVTVLCDTGTGALATNEPARYVDGIGRSVVIPITRVCCY